MERLNSLEEIRFWEHPPFSGIAQTEEKNQEIFEENLSDLLQPHFETHRGVMVKLGMISGPFQAIFCLPSSRGAQSQTVRAERSITPYSTEIHRRDQDYKYIIGCNVGEFFDDYWNVDGDRELSETRTGFTRFTILIEKPPDGKTWSGERLTGKQTTSRPGTLWPETWKAMSDASKRKEKQKWAIEKTEARQC